MVKLHSLLVTKKQKDYMKKIKEETGDTPSVQIRRMIEKDMKVKR